MGPSDAGHLCWSHTEPGEERCTGRRDSVCKGPGAGASFVFWYGRECVCVSTHIHTHTHTHTGKGFIELFPPQMSPNLEAIQSSSHPPGDAEEKPHCPGRALQVSNPGDTFLRRAASLPWPAGGSTTPRRCPSASGGALLCVLPSRETEAQGGRWRPRRDPGVPPAPSPLPCPALPGCFRSRPALGTSGSGSDGGGRLGGGIRAAGGLERSPRLELGRGHHRGRRYSSPASAQQLLTIRPILGR